MILVGGTGHSMHSRTCLAGASVAIYSFFHRNKEADIIEIELALVKTIYAFICRSLFNGRIDDM